MGNDEAVKKVEALLFASGKAMEEEHIKELAELKPKETKDALVALKEKYDAAQGALFIFNDGSRWKINVREDYITIVKSLVAETELDRPVLQTLAMIAFKTPVLQSDIVKARGDGAYAHIAELVERGFVTKEKYGRSFKIRLNEKFYNYFDVTGDKDIRELFKEVQTPEPIIPPDQKKLGDLDVVEAEGDEAHEKLRKESQLEIYGIKQIREDDKKNYLNGFESRLSDVSGRIDEAEKEIIAQRPVQEEENLMEEVFGQETTTETEEEKEDLEAPVDPEAEDEPAKILKDVERQIEELTGKKEE